MLENNNDSVEKDRIEFQKLEYNITFKNGHNRSNDYEINYDSFIIQITELEITKRIQF